MYLPEIRGLFLRFGAVAWAARATGDEMSGSRLPEQGAPQAERRPVTTTIHGHSRVDDYAWLRDPAYPEVESAEIRAYLEAENAYLDAALLPVKALQGRVFEAAGEGAAER